MCSIGFRICLAALLMTNVFHSVGRGKVYKPYWLRVADSVVLLVPSSFLSGSLIP